MLIEALVKPDREETRPSHIYETWCEIYASEGTGFATSAIAEVLQAPLKFFTNLLFYQETIHGTFAKTPLILQYDVEPLD